MTIATDLTERLQATRERLADLDADRAGLIAERDQLVRQAAAQGASLREIADVVGLSHVAVQNIVNRPPPD